jgi:CheY-like chemotaxis protein
VARGGQQAVECVLVKDYALVLMDCEMPEMDGYSTARRIRALEPPGSHLPIIACSAHTLVAERQRMLASGMDDYLIKPLTRDALCRVLAEWLPEDALHPASSGTRLSPSASKHAAERAARAAAEPAPDLAPRQRSERMLDLFVTQVPDELQALSRAVEQVRREEVATRAQQLRSRCSSYGAMKMAALCALLEGASALSAEQLRGHVQALGSAYSALLDQLGEARANPDGAPTTSSRDPNPEAP